MVQHNIQYLTKVGLIFLMLLTLFPLTQAFLCYQETANVSTDCGGLATGNYRVADISATDGGFYINYTKPYSATSAIWQTKHGNLSSYNTTLPSACFSNLQTIQVRLFSGVTKLSPLFVGSYGQCYNTTDWQTITSTAETNSTSGTSAGTTYSNLYDGNWATSISFISLGNWQNPIGGNLLWKALYEEAMIWNITNFTITQPTPGQAFIQDAPTSVFNATLEGQMSSCRWSLNNGLNNFTMTKNSNFTSTVGTCYQETANVSTACGGLATGTYGFKNGASLNWTNPERTYDGDMTTYANVPSASAEFYVNYTIPKGAVGAIWNVRTGGSTMVVNGINTTLTTSSIGYYDSGSCWNNNGGVFSIKGTYTGYFYCFNGTDWNGFADYTGGSAYAIYEERMYWNISTYYEEYWGAINTTMGSDGNKNITMYCNDSSNLWISSSSIPFLIDSVNITSCRNLTVSRTYNILNNLEGGSSNCLSILNNNTVLNGNFKTINSTAKDIVTAGNNTQIWNITLKSSTGIDSDYTSFGNPDPMMLYGFVYNSNLSNMSISFDLTNSIYKIYNTSLKGYSKTYTTLPGFGTYLYQYWYFNSRVNTTSSNLQNANVTIKDKNNQIVYSGLTNSNGVIPQQNILDFQFWINDTSNSDSYYSPFNITVTKTGFVTNSSIVNITQQTNYNHYVTLKTTLLSNITSPTNLSYLNYNQSINLNFTITNYTAASCLFTVNNYATNTSIPNCANTTFNVSDGNIVLKLFVNDSTGTTSESSVNFTVDATSPQISFGDGTADNYANLSQNWIYINTTWTEANFKNISFKLYDWLGVTELTNNSNTPIYWVNFTGRADTGHFRTYNVTICDVVGNCKSIARVITLDYTNPNATLKTPTNNTITNIQSQNYTANLTDNNGIKNATLNIYNSTGLVNQTSTNFVSSTTKSLLGIVVTLVDNVYTWFYQVFDWAGNSYTTGNNTITIDTVNPNVQIVYPTNNSNFTNPTSFNYTTSDAVSGLNTCKYSLNNGATNTTITCGTNVTNMNPSEGLNTLILYVTDNVGNANSSSVTFRKDSIAPTISIASPTNNGIYKDLYTYNLSLNVSGSDSGVGIQNWFYSLNGANNITFTPNISIIGIAGRNNLTVYVNDTLGNTNSSTITFNLTFEPKIDDINISNSTTSYSRDYLSSASDQLKFWYTFDQNRTDLQIDSMGTSNVTSIGTLVRFQDDGIQGGSFFFPQALGGEGGQVFASVPDTGGISAFNKTQSYSIIIWFKTANKADQSLSEHWNGGSGYPWAIRGPGTSTGTVSFATYNGSSGGSAGCTAPGNYADNKWHMFTVTRTVSGNTNLSCYMDGVIVHSALETTAGNILSGSNGFVIGARSTAGAYSFNGSIDEFRIYNRSLTATEISNLYSVYKPTFQEYANVTLNVTVTDEDTSNSNLWYSWLVDGVQKLSGFAQNIFNYVFNTKSSVVTLNVNDTNNYSVSQSWNVSETYVYPTIDYGAGTSNDGVNLSQSNIYINTTWTEANFANITFRANSNIYFSSVAIYDYNFTGLSNATYYYNVTLCDLVGQCNTTATRKIVLDMVKPNATLVYPTNNTYNNSISQNFTANLTDNLSGIKNATLNIYNETGIYNQTSVTLTGQTQSLLGIVVSVVDSVYKWFYTLFDFAGNSYTTQNNTLTIDRVLPTISIVSPQNTTYKDIYSYNLSLNVSYSDNIGMSNFKYSLDSGVTNTTFTPNSTVTGLAAGTNTLTVYAQDLAGNINSTSVTFYLEFTPKINDINISNSSTSYDRNSLTDGLVGWWKFDENRSDYIKDSALGNNATIYSYPNASFDQNGAIGGSYQFDGIAGYATTASSSIYNLTDNFTIITWVYPSKSSYVTLTTQAESVNGEGFNVTRGATVYRLGNFTTGPVALIDSYIINNSDFGTMTFIISGNTTATNAINYTIKDSDTGEVIKTGATSLNTNGINGQVLFTGFEPLGKNFSISIYYTNLTSEASVDSFTIERGGRDGIVNQQNGIRMFISGSTFRYQIRNITGVDFSSTPLSVSARKWQMVAMTFNNSRVTMYKDNSSTSASFNGPVLGTTNPLNFAFEKNFGFGQAWLKIDEVRIYNRTLSTAEIQQIYSITNPTFQEYPNVTINATITDEDTPQASLFYSWWVDSVSVLTGFAQNIFNYIFTQKSSIVTLTVNDTNNYSVSQSWNVSTTYVNPQINFTSPTPTNNTYQNYNSVYVNVSASDTSPTSVFLDWNNSVVGWWRLESGNGTFFADYKGIVNGTCNDTACPTYNSSGMRGGAYSFDGTDDLINITNTAPFNLTNFTLSMWWNVGSLNIWSGPFNNQVAGQYGFKFVNELGSTSVFTPHLVIFDTAGNEIGNYFDNETYNSSSGWKHFVWTYNGTVNFYVDGVSKTVLNSSVNSYPTSGVYIGRGYGVVGGSIDDVIVLNDAINSMEVSAIYDATSIKYSKNLTNLADGVYNYRAYVQDRVGNVNSTELRKVTIDTTFPQISYGDGTAVDFANLSQSNIYINTTWTEINFKNITFKTNFQTNNYFVATYAVNFTTGITNGSYYYNVTLCDLANNCNTTATRKITLDTGKPSATLNTPTNNTHQTTASNNFTVNLTDNLGIKNATLNIYNSTGLVNQTTSSFVAGTLTNTLGIVVSLIDNVYTWFYQVFDWAGNTAISQNFTANVDVGNLDFCHPINTAGTYLLNKSITAVGNCFEIKANNVVFDCNNYSLTGTSASGYGIFTNGYNNLTIKNCNINNFQSQVFLQNSDNNTLTNITTESGVYTSFYGIRLENVDNTLIKNSTIEYANTQSFYGIYLANTSNITIQNSRINTNLFVSVANAIYSNGGNYFYANDNYLFGSGTAMNLISTNNSYIRDSTVSSEIKVDCSANNTFLNTSETTRTISTCTGPAYNDEFVKQWYLNTKVTDVNNNPINLAIVQIYDYTGDNIFNAFTNSSGDVDRQIMTQFIYDGLTKTDYTPHTINISYTSYVTNTTVLNITSNKNHTVKLSLFDLTAPALNIVYPINANYSNVSSINYTVSDSGVGLSSCWYSTGVTNTTITCGTNITGLVATQGSNTWTVYANDTNGNLNTTSINFFVDYILPNATLISPSNNTITNVNSQNLTANLTDNLGVKNATLYILNKTGNKWLQFDGTSNAYAKYTGTGMDIGTNNFTIMAWIKTNTNANQRILARENYAGELGTDSMILRYYDGNSWLSSGLTIPNDTWTFVAVVRGNASNYTFYVNNVTNNTAGVAQNVNGNLYIGNSYVDDGRFNGSIDEVRIFNRSLTEEEMLYIYAGGTTSNPDIADTTDMLVWYDFQDTDGNTSRLTDTFLGQFNATIVGATYKMADAFIGGTVNYGTILSTTIGIVVNLVEGVYDWWYSLFDVVGNQYTSDNRTITIDNTAPTISITFPVNGTNYANAAELNYTSSGGANRCWYSTNGGATNSSTVACGTNFTINPAEGWNTWNLYANDEAGNLNSAKTTFYYDAVNVSYCRNFVVAGVQHILNQSINTTGTCINFQAANVVLDFKGYTIRGDGVGGDYGLYINAINNATVKNGYIDNFGKDGSGGFGIYLRFSQQDTIQNMTISNGTDAIRLFTAANNKIYNTTLTQDSNDGLSFYATSNYNVIENLNTLLNNADGIYFSTGNSYNNLTNVVSSNNQQGTEIVVTSNGNIFKNVTFTSNTEDGISLYCGVVNSFINVTSTGNTQYDLAFRSFAGNCDGTSFEDSVINKYSIQTSARIKITNSTYGQITFINPISGTGSNFNSDILLINNSVYVNSSISGLNSSANITLYNIGNRNFIYPAILRDGKTCLDCYNFTNLTATNVLFNVSSWSNYSIGEDTVYPLVNIVSPPNLQVYNNETINLNYTAFDANLQACWYSDNGAANQSITCGTNTTLTHTDGQYTVTVYANDTQNHINSSTATYYISTSGPAMTLAYNPFSNTYSNNQTVLFNFTAVDGNGLSTCQLWGNWSGGWHKNQSITTAISGNQTNFALINLPEGNYIWSVWCNNTLGLSNFYPVNHTLHIDLTVPTATLNTPANNTYSSSGSVNLSSNLTDNFGIKNASLYIDGALSSTISYSEGVLQQTLGIVVALTDGIYKWFYQVFDFAGSSYTTQNNTLTIDTIYPNITIKFPTDNTWYNYQVGVNYTVNDTNIQACWWTNNSGVSNNSITCGTNITSTWAQGTVNVTIYANDSAGNTNSSSIGFYVDTIYPLISYGDGTAVDFANLSQSNIYINTTWTEVNPKNITFTIDSVNYTYVIPPNSFLLNLTGQADGVHYYNVTICDQASNCNTTATRKITLDTNNPNATLIFPANATYNSSNTQNFTANLTDNTGIKNATLNIYNSTGLYNSTTTTFVAGTTQNLLGIVVTLVNNVYNWFYQVFDFAGNSYTTANNTITMDNINPNINITSPLNQSYTTTALTLSVNPSETISSYKYSFDSGITNTTFTSPASITANAGSNVLRVYGTDLAGNENYSQVTFYVEYSGQLGIDLSHLPSSVEFGTNVTLKAITSTYNTNVTSCNFSLSSPTKSIFTNSIGSKTGSIWLSTSYVVAETGTFNYNVTCVNQFGVTNTTNGTFSADPYVLHYLPSNYSLATRTSITEENNITVLMYDSVSTNVNYTISVAIANSSNFTISSPASIVLGAGDSVTNHQNFTVSIKANSASVSGLFEGNITLNNTLNGNTSIIYFRYGVNQPTALVSLFYPGLSNPCSNSILSGCAFYPGTVHKVNQGASALQSIEYKATATGYAAGASGCNVEFEYDLKNKNWITANKNNFTLTGDAIKIILSFTPTSSTPTGTYTGFMKIHCTSGNAANNPVDSAVENMPIIQIEVDPQNAPIPGGGGGGGGGAASEPQQNASAITQCIKGNGVCEDGLDGRANCGENYWNTPEDCQGNLEPITDCWDYLSSGNKGECLIFKGTAFLWIMGFITFVLVFLFLFEKKQKSKAPQYLEFKFLKTPRRRY